MIRYFLISILVFSSVIAVLSSAEKEDNPLSGRKVGYILDLPKSYSDYEAKSWRYHVFKKGNIVSEGVEWLEPSKFTDYSVVVLMNGRLKGKNARAWNEKDIKDATDYVQNGGTIIFVCDAAVWFSGSGRDLGGLKNLIGAERLGKVGGDTSLYINDEWKIVSHLKEVGECGWYGKGLALTGLTSAEPLLASTDKKQAYVSVNKIGKGKVFFFGNELFRMYDSRSKISENAASLYAKMLLNSVLEGKPEISFLKKEKWARIPLGKPAEKNSTEANITCWQPPASYKEFGQAPPLYSYKNTGKRLQLASNGNSAAVIVTADTPSTSSSAAVKALKEYIQKITGATINIIRESQVSKNESQIMIIVGDTSLAAKVGINFASIPPEGILIKTLNNKIFILGNENMPGDIKTEGTYYAALTFIEKYMGVRWLWPGDLGTVIPLSPDLSVPEINESFAPIMEQRRIRSLINQEIAPSWRKEIGLAVENLYYWNKTGQEWFSRQKTGARIKYKWGHAFEKYWRLYHETHPDWFALQKDGTRDQSQDNARARLCVSNRELVARAAKDACAFFHANPGEKGYSICPNDGGITSFCMCEECRKLDPPNGEKLTLEYRTPYVCSFDYVSLTNRELTFFNHIAEIVSKKYPDKLLGAYAYTTYSNPPVGSLKAHPNLIMGVVAFSYQSEWLRIDGMRKWKGWHNAASNIFLRPNALYAGKGLPLVYPHRMSEDLKECIKDGLRITDYDGCLHNWASQGLNYYVLAKVLWNPSVDVDSVIDDYCSKGFGKAAPYIRKYFNLLEQRFDKFASESLSRDEESFESLCEIFNPELLSAAYKILADAKKEVEGTPEIVNRIEFLEKGLDYAKVRFETSGKRNPTEIRDFFKKLGLSWALNSLSPRVAP